MALGPSRSTLLKLVPYAVTGTFAGGVCMAPSLFVFRYLVCLAWFTSNDPSQPPISPDDPRCGTREIEAGYASMMAGYTFVSGLAGFAAIGIVQRLADRFGRRPMLFALPLLECLSAMVLLFAFTLNGTTLIYTLISSTAVLSSVAARSGFIPMLIIADVASVEERTPWYSRLNGIGLLGLGSAMVATDILTKLTRSTFGPFYVAISLNFAAAVYALVFIPETRVWTEPAAPEETQAEDLGTAKKAASRALGGLLMPLKPLALLLPRKDVTTGKRNWTLFLLASTTFVSTLGGAFPVLALIIYMQQQFHFTPGENGYVLAWLLGTKFFYLVFVFPVVLKFGRRAFHRYQLRHPIHQPVVGEAPALVDETTPLIDPEVLAEGEAAQEGEVLVVEKPEALANHFDVILAYISLLLDVVGMLLVSFSTRWQQVVFAFAVLSTSAGFRPSINSTFLACVPPAQASEVLAALEILVAIAYTASSVVLGAVYALLVKSGHAPLLFAVSAALQFVASLFLLPIKRI